MVKRPNYEIPKQHPSEEFLRARNLAGLVLQEQFKKLGGKFAQSKDYRWIKAELTWPSFDHLTFAYRNQVFAVLVELIDGENSLLSEQECKRCFDACVKHNLVPCVFQVSLGEMRPMISGWNLLALETSLPLNPADLCSDSQIEMSTWEARNLAIQIVLDRLTDSDLGRVTSFTDVLGIDPQVWIENSRGSRCWIVVRFCRQILGNEIEQFVNFTEGHPQLAGFDGYFAAVSATSSAAILIDHKGKIIPPSRRFDGSAPLYRGDEFYIKFDGLKLMHKAYAQ